MCGILFSTISRLERTTFENALQRMDYRGPDASGIWQKDHLMMGHRRLAIIDLDPRSNQPFTSTDGRYTIIFNGEIYNFQQLAKQYHLNLHTQSDTEVLLALYALLGPSMLSQLNGMFAFVIVDHQTGQWFAARDRLGVKPLYLSYYRDGLILSSEPAAILHIINKREFDDIGVRQYRKLRTFFNGRTIWKNISQFPPGHYLSSEKSLTQWWSLPDVPQSPPSDEALRHLITDAVTVRKIADVKVGSYLSGGLDSTIVASLAGELDTWTVGFPRHNEFNWAKLAAEAIHSEHHEVLIHYADFLAIAKKMIALRAEPLSVPNEVLLYQMTLQVAKKNKVILSGEGADELFFGYDRIFRWAGQSTWDIEAFSKLYSYGSHADIDIVEDAIKPFLGRKDALSIVAAFFQIAHLQGLLRRLDSATMLCSVEGRVPFVDYRLVEALAGVPYQWRMAEEVVKAPLKRIFADIVPPDILTRPKVGFPVPLAELPLSPYAGETAFDQWVEFNLSELAGVPIILEEVI